MTKKKQPEVKPEPAPEPTAKLTVTTSVRLELPQKKYDICTLEPIYHQVATVQDLQDFIYAVKENLDEPELKIMNSGVYAVETVDA